MEPTFVCKMTSPKRFNLKSQRYQLSVECLKVEGFTLGKDGRDRKNGINFNMLGKIIGIKKLGAV